MSTEPVRFIMRNHAVTGGPIVDVIVGQRLAAVIYPHELGLHIVSKYLTGAVPSDGEHPGCFVVLDMDAPATDEAWFKRAKYKAGGTP